MPDVRPQASGGVAPPSPDSDYDGLPDTIEAAGWSDQAGFFMTDPHDRDSDDDGLSDGQEKLFETDPLNDRSPGLYIEYENQFMTRQYADKYYRSPSDWGWQQYGNKLISIGEAVVRRGAMLTVGGPADAALTVEKSRSSLTTLTPTYSPCTGRWQIAVPAKGTVGDYRLVVQEGSWRRTLDLYVIFELPEPGGGLTQDMIDVFLYDDDPLNMADETAILLNSNGMEYTSEQYPRIPVGAFVNEGDLYKYDCQQFESFVFEKHVINTINGLTSQQSAVAALLDRVDQVTRFNNPRPISNSWSVLHPGVDDSQQCSNISGLMAAFARSAGIPSRPLLIDWVHSTFDHANEIWFNGAWWAARGYNGSREETCGWSCNGGFNLPQTRSDWGGGRYRPWHSGGGGSGSVILAGGVGWPTGLGGADYRWPSWDRDTIVKKPGAETLFVPYWRKFNWRQEPAVIGEPPGDWPWHNRQDLTLNLSTFETETGFVVRGVSDRGVDLDGDGRWDQLLVELEVVAPQAGTYSLQGQLGPLDPALAAFGSGGLVAVAEVQAGLEPGVPTVATLTFEGLKLSSARADGPYVLRYLSLTDAAQPAVEEGVSETLGNWTDVYTTGAYRALDFQNPGALLSNQVVEQAVDRNNNGRSDELVMQVAVHTFEGGPYTVSGALYDRQGFVSWATWTGDGPLATLAFEGLAGTAGPYTLQEVELYDAEGVLIDRLEGVYTTEQELAVEGKSQLLAPEAGRVLESGVITGMPADHGVDQDGDGLYDLLVVDVPVAVDATDVYRIEGWLAQPDGRLVTWASSEATSLVSGTHTLSLPFSGLALNGHHVDGPLELTALKLVQGSGYGVVDERAVVYTTGAYDADQFERIPYPVLDPGHTIVFQDHMHQAGGWSAEGTWGLANRHVHTPQWTWTDSPDGNYEDRVNAALTTPTIGLPAYSWSAFEFSTCYSLEAESDYGYVELSTDGGMTWTQVASYTGSTAGWSRELLDLNVLGDTTGIQLRFRLETDGGATQDGWYIDDVIVYVDDDADDDGFSNDVEIDLGTDPLDPDTDGDGIPDAEDWMPTVFTYRTWVPLVIKNP